MWLCNQITARLQELYSSRFGAEALEIIRDSSDVDRADLDPNVNYVQVLAFRWRVAMRWEE